MKDFMLIFIGVDYAEMELSPEEIQGRAQSWMTWQEKMEKQGVLKGGNALQSDLKRINGPDRTITDRASTEIKEIIGGYYLVQAENIERAIGIAQDYPDYDLGGKVEVRELMYYN
ncbi:YciI family protein [Fulvivirgaceae bacterium BMA10]|uniref:YciI family protein n=1 Tax=Splendidivirga corallicola TaxID=3051826 RepID=A0ABT8KVS2_9BACT|nr:YciI family protein [Fulvivirgaceae bacterium BMA10]